MTVGELRQLLFEVCDDNLPVHYLAPDTSLEEAYAIKGVVMVEKSTGKTDALKGMYLLRG